MERKDGNKAQIFEISLFSSSMGDLLEELEGKLRRGAPLRPILVFTPNPEMLMAAAGDPEFKKILLKADYNIPDGIGVVLASRWRQLWGKSGSISERITGTDLMLKLVSLAPERGWRVFLLGGQPGVAQAAAANLKLWYPKLEVRAASGPADLAKASPEENRQLVDEINQFQTDLLFVAFGHGKQERWLKEHQSQLKVRLGMGVGGALDFVAGRITRAPTWVQSVGLEWAYRLLQEPSRLSRIVTATIKFPLRVLRES